jgi:hypothetical protein
MDNPTLFETMTTAQEAAEKLISRVLGGFKGLKQRRFWPDNFDALDAWAFGYFAVGSNGCAA